MARDPDKIDRWMTLEAVEAAIPAMEATGTSEVARGVKPSKQTAVGFIEAYRFAEGDPETMAELPATKTSSWADRRRQFVSRHLAQMRSSDTHSDGFKPDGTPTKRMLGLIAWAYVPPESQRKAKAWYKAGCPMKATRKRRNNVQSALFTEKLLGLPVMHFASGSNHPAEIRGFGALRKPVGVAAAAVRKDKDGRPTGWAPLCTRDCEDALVEVARKGVPVFIDSGAFSEIDFGPQGPYDVLPIEHDEWLTRLALYERVVDRVGPENAHLVNIVAPDKVADQQTTLARMRTYGPIMRRLREKGASVLVPLQKAPPGLGMTIAQFHDAARDALGFPAKGWVAAIPMKKDATTPEDLEAYLRSKKPERIHLLGVGPTSRRAGEIADAVRRGSPRTQVQGDSVLIRAKVGRPKSGPKPLTAAQDVMREEARAHRFHDYPDEYRSKQGDGLIGYTDAIAEPSLWIPASMLARIARLVGLSGEDRKAWVNDPDDTLQRGYQLVGGKIRLTDEDDADPLYLYPPMADALDASWAAYSRGAEVAPVKDFAIRRVFADEGPVSVYRNNPESEPLFDRRASLLTAQKLPVPQAAESLVRRLGRGRVGTTERVMTRGDAAEVPGLARMGYLQILRVLQPSETGIEWKVYDVKTTRRLHDAVDATQEAREAYREEFQQASLFGAPRRRNVAQTALLRSIAAPEQMQQRQARPFLQKPEGGWFDLFSQKTGAPRSDEKGYVKPPQAIPEAWDGQSPYEAARAMLQRARKLVEDPEAAELITFLKALRFEWDVSPEEYEYYRGSEFLEGQRDPRETLAFLLGVPRTDGKGKPISQEDRDSLALLAVDYALLEDGQDVSPLPPLVIDPGKSRKGASKARKAEYYALTPEQRRDTSEVVFGHHLAEKTPSYNNKLRLVNVDKETAQRFIEKHHSALPYLNPRGLLLAMGAMQGDRLVAVATIGTPSGAYKTIADPTYSAQAQRRFVNPYNVVDLNRVASDGTVKGAASKLVSRILKIVPELRRGDPKDPALLVTFQLVSEPGTTYKGLADRGLRPVAFAPGVSAKTGARAGTDEEDVALGKIDKIKWEYSPTKGFALPARWDLLKTAAQGGKIVRGGLVLSDDPRQRPLPKNAVLKAFADVLAVFLLDQGRTTTQGIDWNTWEVALADPTVLAEVELRTAEGEGRGRRPGADRSQIMRSLEGVNIGKVYRYVEQQMQDPELRRFASRTGQGALFARNNPSGWDDPHREGSEVQSVIFDAGRWTLGEARAWLRRHAYDGLTPDRTAHTIRFRQRPPSRYRRDTFRTIPMGQDTGIQAVVAVPR